MEIRSLAFRTDLMVRRLAGSHVSEHPDHLVVRTPHNPDFWWGNFVLVGTPERSGGPREWRALFDRELPDAGHVAIGLDTLDGWAGPPDELAAIGVAADVFEVLTAGELREPPHPHREAVCRPLAGDADWAAALELTLAVWRAEGEDSPVQARFAERRLAEARGLAAAGAGRRYGAFVDGELRASLGVVAGEDGLARFQTVETHPDWRRRGIAGTLVHAAGMSALAAGARTLVIVAEQEGTPIRLYRSLGFAARERQVELNALPG